MFDIFRDAPVGQLIRWISRNRYLQYPDERPGFQLPRTWNQKQISDLDLGLSFIEQSSEDLGGDIGLREFGSTSAILPDEGHQTGFRPSMQDAKHDDTIIVDWYSDHDSENPQNWTHRKKVGITLIICLYTFVVYTSSAIYTSSIQGVMNEFGVDTIKSTLGLSLYVLGYGIGPLIFSPLSEIPSIGRNPVYAVTMIIFVIISVPTAFATTFESLVILRFFQGFFGSPCLASGAASLSDMFDMATLPYAMLAWVSASYCGPALGPLLSGFSVPAKSWRWSLFECIWASAPVLIAMLLFLPETSSESILLQRAKRISRLTGKRIVTPSQMQDQKRNFMPVLLSALIKPVEITFKDPAVLFVQIYTSIIYGIYYSFFEVFPLVYPVYYGMSLGQLGLVFLCILIACILGVVAYSLCLYYMGRRGFSAQETRLLPALGFCFGPTIGLFVFAWTARPSIHWIAPTLGITIYGSSVFVVFQCLFIYIPLSYPQYAASLFAANDFFRSAVACGSVLFAHPLFGNLGVAKGVSLLGGLSVIGIIGIWILYFYGAKLRSMSKFAMAA